MSCKPVSQNTSQWLTVKTLGHPVVLRAKRHGATRTDKINTQIYDKCPSSAASFKEDEQNLEKLSLTIIISRRKYAIKVFFSCGNRRNNNFLILNNKLFPKIICKVSGCSFSSILEVIHFFLDVSCKLNSRQIIFSQELFPVLCLYHTKICLAYSNFECILLIFFTTI